MVWAPCQGRRSMRVGAHLVWGWVGGACGWGRTWWGPGQEEHLGGDARGVGLRPGRDKGGSTQV